MAFTRPVLYPHMTQTHPDFVETQDFFELLLERKKVARTFTAPPHPIPPIGGVAVYLGELCGATGCARFFLDPDELINHVRTQHAETPTPEETPCYIQEVQELGGRSSQFRVLWDDLDPSECFTVSNIIDTALTESNPSGLS
jgi:hypothetical protein